MLLSCAWKEARLASGGWNSAWSKEGHLLQVKDSRFRSHQASVALLGLAGRLQLCDWNHMRTCGLWARHLKQEPKHLADHHGQTKTP